MSVSVSRRMMVCVVFIIVCFAGSVAANPNYRFGEVWGYLMQGEERYLKGYEPISDIGYFSARLNEIGRLPGSITRPKLSGPKRRVHLVISAPASSTLMYFCLSKNPTTRSGLINDILRLSEPFDGVQVDFEVMRPQERAAYISFLAEIKRRLPANKILSVALPARTELKEDAFSYAGISAVVDRVLIMAYDEHWRTGPPGAIASAQWCKQVCVFAQRTVPAKKLVMGLPLYGRVWQKDKVARALKYPETLKLWEQGRPVVKRLSDQTPYFEYKTSVTAAVYFEDTRSLSTKLSMYKQAGVRRIGFWRLGQGPSDLWQRVEVGW